MTQVCAVGVAQIVVGHDVGGLAPGPGNGESVVDEIKTVDVRVIVVALDVPADGRPSARAILV